jgi:putative NADPH-quinone reductase
VRVIRHDLYAEGFDPVLSGAELARRYSLESDVQRYTTEVRESKHFIFVHPDWWSGPPALLKGWIERVFRPGVAYDWEGEEFQEKRHVPLLRGHSATVYIASDRSEGDPQGGLRAFWSDVCEYSGITLRGVRVFPDMRGSTFRQRRAWLAEVRQEALDLAHGHSAPQERRTS